MPRLLTLQAVRGGAANLVVPTHLYGAAIYYNGTSALPALSFYGVAGVDLFFRIARFRQSSGTEGYRRLVLGINSSCPEDLVMTRAPHGLPSVAGSYGPRDETAKD